MSDYVIMPKADYQATCDSLRSANNTSDPIKSGAISPVIDALANKINNLTNQIGKAAFQSYPMLQARWSAITYGNGKFVAVADNSQYAAYSIDGINWQEVDMQLSARWKSIAYGNGKFVAISQGYSGKAACSTDGLTWTTYDLPSDISWASITHGNGVFVITGSASSILSYHAGSAYSTDGISWTRTNMPRSGGWYSVTYGDGKFVSMNYSASMAAYSTDGITWNKATLSGSGWYAVTYGNGKFVALTNTGSSDMLSAYSTDGITWTLSTEEVPSGLVYVAQVVYGNGIYLALSETAKHAYSKDGVHWELISSLSGGYFAVYADKKFIAVPTNKTLGTCACCDLNVGIV